MGLHVSIRAQALYDIDEAAFSPRGFILFPDLQTARLLALKMNEKRDLASYPDKTVRAGDLYGMGLILEIMRYVAHLYREQTTGEVMERALEYVADISGEAELDNTLARLTQEYAIGASDQAHSERLTPTAGTTRQSPRRQELLEELEMLWLANMNPASIPYRELFDDTPLKSETAYIQLISGLRTFFHDQPTFGPDDQNLIDFLRSPAVAAPHSIYSQLEYVREKWGFLLGPYLTRLLVALDAIKEEERARFLGPGPTQVYDFTAIQGEAERFSPDQDWMPRVALMAKNAYVWLEQLSKKYQRPITRLDEIPNEELDTLAAWGFTGLWLIGMWQRSRASQVIKRLCGNPGAAASAYSIFDYQIADGLGGEESFWNLKERAWQRGIRLASDMVPNHTGIDSRWLIEHPDWFVSVEHSPFPAYTFNGLDLSDNDRVGVFLEDHYYSRSDAAVVFKRVDRWTGSEKYVYHGNDGTRMPWNDTAQLDYLNPQVREAVIQEIIQVARRTPIIRFDAAMTLTRQHYQRLWFPEPGMGGDIPSRAEHGLTRSRFDALMPTEFWRVVVDRVAQEAPGTLLLAEAFWLLEGYFVRTLGMHRVYNSAFMNMLKAEENWKYRALIKNVLEFDPEILKRFVNFMSNPDEETAEAQFGRDDKYFGVCIMMVTMPGLPMFGHGQIEGYTEKYGMEYMRAYVDEQADYDLIQRHEREIFPLLKRRHLFMDAQNFVFYDLITPEGGVNENVYAYSNSRGEEKALVVYNNKYERASGCLRNSVSYLAKTGKGDERKMAQTDLGEALGLHRDGHYYCIFRDQISGLEYIRRSGDLSDDGLYIELGAFKYMVYLDFYELQDAPDHRYALVERFLDGRGVPSVQEAVLDVLLQPVVDALGELVGSEAVLWRLSIAKDFTGAQLGQVLWQRAEANLLRFAKEVKDNTGAFEDEAATAQQMGRRLTALLQLYSLDRHFPWPQSRKYGVVVRHIRERLASDPRTAGALMAWLNLGPFSGLQLEEWALRRLTARVLREFSVDRPEDMDWLALTRALVSHCGWSQKWRAGRRRAYRLMDSLLQDSDARQVLKVHSYNGIEWYHKESLEQLLWWLLIIEAVERAADSSRPPETVAREITACYDTVEKLRKAHEGSGHQIERLLRTLKE